MENQYKAQRSKNIFPAEHNKPYKLSRSKIEAFMSCKRCFFLDRKCGTLQPPMYPYTLNKAVDKLLKASFDKCRSEQKPHRYMTKYLIDALPYDHPNIEEWRSNQSGIKYHHEMTNFTIYGAIDDVWITPQEELIIVDYKATSSAKEVSINERDSYKRQMEIYQWLFRKNGFKVSDTGYFVYCNADTNGDNFADLLNFDITLLPYTGNDMWIEDAIHKIYELLVLDKMPKASENCEYCSYTKAVINHIKKYETADE
jgi:hypothetical protein